MKGEQTEIGSESKNVYEDKPRSVSSPSLHNASDEELGEVDAMAIPAAMVKTKWQRMANNLEAASGAEARGIERVEESMRMGRSHQETTLTWQQLGSLSI